MKPWLEELLSSSDSWILLKVLFVDEVENAEASEVSSAWEVDVESGDTLKLIGE